MIRRAKVHLVGVIWAGGTNQMISIVAAIGKNRELGIKDKIPWHIREDLLRFKNLTLEKTVVVGRKTFESLLSYYQKSQRPFPKRNYFIVTKNADYIPDLKNVVEPEKSQFRIFKSVDEAIFEAKKNDKGEIFLIGGASIFKQGIKYANRLYLTLVDGDYPDADAYFPDYSDFKKIESEEKRSDGKYTYKFMTLSKV